MAGQPRLIVLSEHLRGKNYELNKELHTVGRVSERDICIKDTTISTYHCDFVKDGDSYILRDKESTNGSRINNIPIVEQKLENSDIIQLGGVEMLYDCDDKSVTTVMRTQTGINLEGTELNIENLRGMRNVSPFEKDKSRAFGVQKAILFLVVLLILIILGLVGFLVYAVYGSDKDEDIKLQKTTTTVVTPSTK